MSIDFRARAEKMHRRAQKAEGALSVSSRLESFWKSAHLAICRDLGKAIRSEHDLRKERDRLQREVNRLRGKHDPLTRIIELGRRFS